MEKNGAIDYVNNLARKIVQESWKEVDSLLPTSGAKEKLKHIVNFLIERKI
jgi:geranylgeranyl pyrophosphate synthase